MNRRENATQIATALQIANDANEDEMDFRNGAMADAIGERDCRRGIQSAGGRVKLLYGHQQTECSRAT